MNVTAYARVQMTVGVETPDCYGSEWTLDKVQAQVASEAMERVAIGLPKGVRIVGTPTLVDIVIRKKA